MNFIQQKHIDRSVYYDYKISRACAIYFIMSVFNATVKTVAPTSSIVSYMSLVSGGIIFLSYLLCICEVMRRSGRLLINSYMCFGAIYLLSLVLILCRNESCDLMISGSAFLTFCWWIPIGVFSSSIFDKRIYYEVLLKSSFILLALLAIMFFFHPLTKYDEFGYNMFFGYNMVIPTIFHLNELIKYKKKKYVFLVLAEFIMLLIYANRGAWMPIIFFIAYRYLFISYKNKSMVISLLSIGICLMVVFSTLFFSFVSVYLEDNFGISSRTLELLLSGEMQSYKSGRDEIWMISKNMIYDNPILGWGLGGEFYHLAEAEGAIPDSTFTPHNGILQNLVNFGVIGGFIASIMFIKPYFQLSRIKDSSYFDLCLIFGSIIIANFYSASGFFIKPACAIFIYLFYNYKRWYKYIRL